MGKALFVTLLFGVVLVCTPVPTLAQEPRDPVEEVREAFGRLDYEAAELLARAAIELGALSLAQRTELHTTLALIAFTRNDLDEARRQFELALDLQADLTLDPLLVSPKALDFLAEVRRSRLERQAGSGPAPRYVVVRDPRPEAALRSMVLPGWGQLYKGQRAKGWILAGLWTVTATSSLYSHTRWRTSREAYLDERDPNEVAARYDDANRWYKTRNNLLVGAAGVWLVSYVDALLSRGPEPPAGSSALRVTPFVSPEEVRLTLHVRF